MTDRLFKDLNSIGMPTDFTLEIRGYSKRHFGLYLQNKSKVILYPYEDKEKTRLYPYEVILKYAVHEVCHHIQWTYTAFFRIKGVMHDPEFYKLFNEYWGRAEALLFYKEIEHEKISYRVSNPVYRNGTANIAFI